MSKWNEQLRNAILDQLYMKIFNSTPMKDKRLASTSASQEHLASPVEYRKGLYNYFPDFKYQSESARTLLAQAT